MKSKEAYIIAEIGPNHNGDEALAIEMIEKLSKIGVNAIKFQIAVPENVYSKDSFKPEYQKQNEKSKSPIQMAKRHQLSYEQHRLFYNVCRENNVDYLCSAFDLASLEFLLSEFELPYLKIASGEIFSVDMMDVIAKTDIPVILSTGMATFDDIEKAVGLLNKYKKKDITILHCISNYPTQFEEVNMGIMSKISSTFGYPAGFSDHTIGNIASVVAVSQGATIIEKHVTKDKNLEGPDHKASITIEEFGDLVKAIRDVETIISGPETKTFTKREEEVRRSARKSIIAARELKKDDVITREDLVIKRPGFGISPLDMDKVIGRQLLVDVEEDRIIKPEYLS